MIYRLTYVDFLTNFALGCVNSVVGACEILFQKEKFSLSSFDVIDCRTVRYYNGKSMVPTVNHIKLLKENFSF